MVKLKLCLIYANHLWWSTVTPERCVKTMIKTCVLQVSVEVFYCIRGFNFELLFIVILRITITVILSVCYSACYFALKYSLLFYYC